MDFGRYSYGVFWSEEDQKFIGLCEEFPLLSHLDEFSDLAFTGIKALVKDVVEYRGQQN
ncbi:MAG: antitoxin HicB [Spirulina sp. SIO3F2]|nr:antitoxin HicB [Spirulina sp. SIO3F2]